MSLKSSIVLFLLSLFVSGTVSADTLIEIERVGSSEKQLTSEAKKEILKDVIQEVSEEQIIEMIGEEAYNKNQRIIRTRIIRNSGKYLPRIKTSKLMQVEEGTEMTVFLSLSSKSLRDLLLENGLLYGSRGLPTIIPFVQFSDRLNSRSYRWWKNEAKKSEEASVDLEKIALDFESVLKEEFAAKGFYMLSPIGQKHENFLPPQQDDKDRDLSKLADFFQSNLMLTGMISLVGHRDLLEQAKLQLILELKNRKNGRVIAQVQREFQIEGVDSSQPLSGELMKKVNAAGADLAQQLLKSWQKGVFGTSVMRIVLRGPVRYPVVEEFKRGLLKNARYIKSLKERMFEPNQVVFEADVDGSYEKVSEVIQGGRFKGFRVERLEAAGKETVFQTVPVTTETL